MKVKTALLNSCRECLQASLPIDLMIRFATLANPEYDVYRRTGLKEGLPLSKQYAAQRIVEDMIQDGFYVDFVEVLVRIESEGYMGRRYDLWGLNNVVLALVDEGYTFDGVSGQFFENQRERISSNWGRLKKGDDRKMTVLRMDIAGNSALVRDNPRQKIETAYNDLRKIVTRIVTRRLGRLWSWEGDGALAVFLFGSMEKMAVYAGMEILHELFFYNRQYNQLDSPINLRLGAHIGQVWYSDSEMERLKNDTIKEAMVLESLAEKNTMSVSYNLYINMDQQTLNLFSSEKIGRNRKYRLYAMGIEK